MMMRWFQGILVLALQHRIAPKTTRVRVTSRRTCHISPLCSPAFIPFHFILMFRAALSDDRLQAGTCRCS